jgi:hypothetical protein
MLGSMTTEERMVRLAAEIGKALAGPAGWRG